MSSDRLGIGFIGSGFITRFHIQSMVGVREADVLGVWSPNDEHAEAAAALARDLDVGAARAFASIEAMVADPAVDAVWLCGPNHTRVANIDAVCATLTAGATLRGVACEKPLARTVAEAKRIKTLVDEAGLSHGYLENQLFAPAVTRGRELLWRRGAALTGRP
ncbi:MAG: gfo/Idh/MocA family oxidoreductase, partial [Candidatus Neomarinimicrobiota bacterium]